MRQAKIPAVAAALRKGQSSHKQQAERARPDQGQSQGHLSNMLPERGRGRARITSSSRWRCALRLKQVAVQVGVEPAAVAGENPGRPADAPDIPSSAIKVGTPGAQGREVASFPYASIFKRAPPGPRLASIGKRLEPGKPWVPRAKKPKIDRNSQVFPPSLPVWRGESYDCPVLLGT